MDKLNLKLGHQAPKGWKVNKCNEIELPLNLVYNSKHNFVYDKKEENRRLYNAQPCVYTDVRFDTEFESNTLHHIKQGPISIKAAIRKTLKCKGIPKGTIVQFNKFYYFPGYDIDNSYLFKVRKENLSNIQYQVSDPSFFNNFTTCERSYELVNALRDKGFLVQVITEKGVEIAFAYGHGKMVGFSAGTQLEHCYGLSTSSILWCNYGEFDKWSHCNSIPKSTSNKDILDVLLQDDFKTLVHGIQQERYEELYEEEPTNGISLEGAIGQVLDVIKYDHIRCLQMVLIILRNVEPTLRYYYPNSYLTKQVIESFEACITNYYASYYSGLKVYHTTYNGLFKQLGNFPNIKKHYESLPHKEVASLQILNEAIDVFHNAVKALNYYKVKKALIEILIDCFEGYAIFPGSEGRRELFDWWLLEVLSNSLRGD